MRAGRVIDLYRYPVKSMGGERLNEVLISEHGIPGDRSFAFMLEDEKYLTVQKMPHLLTYQSQLSSIPGNVIISKDGTEYEWEDPVLFEQISTQSGRILKQVSFNTEKERGAYWEDHALIITRSSLKKFSEMCGLEILDLRRFRPTIVLDLDDDVPFEEEQWIGKELSIGEARFKVNQGCERCFYITVDPEDPSKINPSILKTLVRERNTIFGVYASVVKTGIIKEGSEVIVHND